MKTTKNDFRIKYNACRYCTRNKMPHHSKQSIMCFFVGLWRMATQINRINYFHKTIILVSVLLHTTNGHSHGTRTTAARRGAAWRHHQIKGAIVDNTENKIINLMFIKWKKRTIEKRARLCLLLLANSDLTHAFNALTKHTKDSHATTPSLTFYDASKICLQQNKQCIKCINVYTRTKNWMRVLWIDNNSAKRAINLLPKRVWSQKETLIIITWFV